MAKGNLNKTGNTHLITGWQLFSYEVNLASQCSHFEVFFKTIFRSEKIAILVYVYF